LYFHQLLSGLVIELRHTLASSQQRLRFLTPNIEEYRRRVDDLAQATHRGLQQHLSLLHERSEGLKRRLEALEPQDTLRRGYAIVQRATDEAIISRVGQARDGESLRITVRNGDFPATTGGKKRPKRNKKKVDSYAGKPLF
jgi:exodeoxyribonuclease VII large subunit